MAGCPGGRGTICSAAAGPPSHSGGRYERPPALRTPRAPDRARCPARADPRRDRDDRRDRGPSRHGQVHPAGTIGPPDGWPIDSGLPAARRRRAPAALDIPTDVDLVRLPEAWLRGAAKIVLAKRPEVRIAGLERAIVYGRAWTLSAPATCYSNSTSWRRTFPWARARRSGLYGGVRQTYRDVARQHGAVLIPFLLDGVAGLPELNQGDGIHPTAAGAEKVTETVWSALRPIVSPND